MKTVIVANEEISPHRFKMIVESPCLEGRFDPGQFFMVRGEPGYDPLLPRPFSIHWMEPGRAEILYRVVGRGTRRMAVLPPGREVTLLGPLGNGFSIPPDWDFALLVAGGMGVAPLRALAARLLGQDQETLPGAGAGGGRRRVLALIGAGRSEDILTEEDLCRLGVEVLISTEDGSRGRPGLVSELLEEVLRDAGRGGNAPSLIYACGPRPLLAKAAGIAGEANIPCQVSLEEHLACGIGACLGCAVRARDQQRPYRLVCRDGPVFWAGEIQW